MLRVTLLRRAPTSRGLTGASLAAKHSRPIAEGNDGAAAGTSGTGTSAVAGEGTSAPKGTPVARKAVFEMRSSPKNLHVKGMRSSLLSEHPLTQKAARDEMLYRQKKLAEIGEDEKMVEVGESGQPEEGATATTAAGTTVTFASNEGVRDYTLSMCALLAGYLVAHVVVFKWYHSEDVRLPYDPASGFVEDIKAKKRETAAIDQHWRTMVVDSIAETKKDKTVKSAPSS